MKKSGAELAFTGTVRVIASHLNYDHGHNHEHHDGCLCDTMNRLAAIIAGGE
jgi:hypothetical protein